MLGTFLKNADCFLLVDGKFAHLLAEVSLLGRMESDRVALCAVQQRAQGSLLSAACLPKLIHGLPKQTKVGRSLTQPFRFISLPSSLARRQVDRCHKLSDNKQGDATITICHHQAEGAEDNNHPLVWTNEREMVRS